MHGINQSELCCVQVLLGRLVFTSRQVVITTSGAFKSLWSEQDGDLTFLQKFNYFFNSTSIK